MIKSHSKQTNEGHRNCFIDIIYTMLRKVTWLDNYKVLKSSSKLSNDGNKSEHDPIKTKKWGTQNLMYGYFMNDNHVGKDVK